MQTNAPTHESGPVISTFGFGAGADVGLAGSYDTQMNTVSAITDATATTVLTITVPNFANSAVVRVFGHSRITTTGHIYDSTRVFEYFIVVTRVAGAVAVAAISAAVGAQIATSAAGQTLTSTLAIAAVAGGATASNSFAVQVTNTGSVAGTSETTVWAEILNAAGVAPAGTGPTGVTVS